MSGVPASPHASGVILALPQLAAFTAPWRATSYAPGHPSMPVERRFPPHVTLLTPFAEADDQQALGRLRRVAERHRPFDLSFSRAQQFGPGGAVWLAPEPHDLVRTLMCQVIEAFPEYPPYEGLHPEPVPHLTVTTVGEADTLAQVDAALQQVGPIRTHVSELGVWQRDCDDVWALIASVPLGPQPR